MRCTIWWAHKWLTYDDPAEIKLIGQDKAVTAQKRTCRRCNAVDYRIVSVRHEQN